MTSAGKGEGGVPNADATVNFACKMPLFADGGGVENDQNLADVICEWSLTTLEIIIYAKSPTL